jgi:cyclophilin family peptidyl-prolyl cis-trans isomerase
MTSSNMQPEHRPAFQQAGLKVEKLEEFEQLQSALTRVFSSQTVEGFLRLLQRKGVPIRDFERVVREGLLEAADPAATKGSKSARQLYEALTVSDQAQIRERYLTALEDVDLSLREKYRKLYRYY